MFGFKSSDGNTPRGDIFNAEEVQQLVLSFPPSNHGSEEDDLIPLASGSGLTTAEALSKACEKIFNGKKGRIPLSDVEKQLDVEQDVILSVIQSREGFMLSQSRAEIVTIDEQIHLVEEMYTESEGRFLPAVVFAETHEIDIQNMPDLIILGDTMDKNSPLQLLEVPSESTSESAGPVQSYIHTLSTILSLKRGILSKVKDAQDEAKIVTWADTEMLGLSSETFLSLCQKFTQEPTEFRAADGFFESGKHGIMYTPSAYLLRKARRTLKEVAMGTVPFCDLDRLARKYPKIIQDVPAAKQFAEKECLHKDGTPYKWHFVSHFAIGDTSLNNTAQKCYELLGDQRYLNFGSFVQSFPDELKRDLLMMLQDRTHLIFRHCGGNQGDLRGMEEHIVFKSLVSDLEFAAKRLGKAAADQAWHNNAQKTSLLDSAGAALFLQLLHEESEAPKDLLVKLWSDARFEIKSTASASFDERIAELENENQSQLEAMWKSRVAIPVNLHEQALQTLEPSPLKEGLQDLLCRHIAQDLVPNALKKLQSKGLIRSPYAQKQVERLQDATKQLSISKELTKFTQKMKLTPPNEDDLSQARIKLLQDLSDSMAKDSDGPRLFLSTVIALMSSKHEKGMFYATGKFAPRLLKTLKASLNAEHVATLERIKDAVKAGTVSEDDRVEMRTMAAKSVPERP